MQKEVLILASASPRRSQLLSLVGIPHEVVPSGIEEVEREAANPEDVAMELASLKAWEVARRYKGRWVIGADTVVWIDGRSLGKPTDGKQALEMLQRLQGRVHEVVTGVCLVHEGRGVKRIFFSRTRVRMRSLSPDHLNWYISTGEPLGKAGGYAIQGIGCALIESIDGSYTNVVGLPMAELMVLLEDLGVWTVQGAMNAP